MIASHPDVVRLVPKEKAFVKAKEEAAKQSDYGLKKNKTVKKTFRGDILQKFRDAFPDDPFDDSNEEEE